MRSGIISDERPDHENVAMGEVDEAQHSVDHGVAERDKRIDAAEGNAVNDLLQQFAHARREL